MQLVAAPSRGSAYPENQENINPNNLSTLSSLNMSSLSELEEMIKGAHPSSLSTSSSGKSDLMQKLKALQLIEQMISTQEQLLSERHDNRDIKQSEQDESRLALSSAGNGALLLRASTHHGQQKGTAQYTLPSYLPPLLKMPPTTDDVDDTIATHDSNLKVHRGSFVNDGCREEVSDLSQSQGVGGEAGRHSEANGHQSDKVEVVRPGESRTAVGHRPSLKEKREEQLRLLNEKIAQRHSKLPRKTDSTNKTAQALSSSSSGASRKTNSSTRKRLSSKPKPVSSKVGASGKTAPRKTKGPAAKVVGKSSLSSKSAPSLHGSKSITSSSSGVPPSHVPLSHDPPSQAPPTRPHLPPSTAKTIDQSTASPQLQHQINSPQMNSLLSEQKAHDPLDDTPLQSVSYSQLVESDEMTAATNSSGLLDSTSYLIPVEGEGEGGGGDETLMANTSAMTDEDITSSRVHSSLPPDIERADPMCEGEEDSLASTLTQAYGFSTTSDFLSTLASPHEEQHGSVEEDTSADSAVKPNGSLHAVQASLFVPPSTTMSVSTMMVDKAATVIQAAW